MMRYDLQYCQQGTSAYSHPCEQLLMTGNMLFEILDPFLMWKQIYFSLRDTIEGRGSSKVSEAGNDSYTRD